ncbi:hypothetical protein DBR43_03680 [Pedobacter sp. KBW06]|nr:hypothetical protein DBR43_03680 [Pedobacter sp. KBW06]
MAVDMRNHLEKQAAHGHEWVVYDTDNPINTQYDLHCFTDEIEAIRFAKEYQQIWNWHEAVPISSLVYDLKKLERSQLRPTLETELKNTKSTLKINNVNMDGQVNRAKQLWENWEHKASQIQELTGSKEDKATLQFKYNYLTKGLNRLSIEPREKEKLYVFAIKNVTAKLQKQLYPNPVIRFLHLLENLFLEKPAQLFLFKTQKRDCLEKLQGQLKSAGLHHFAGNLGRELDFERKKIDLKSLSNLAGENKLEVKVHLEKVSEGSYRFNGYTAAMIDEKGERKSAFFSAHKDVNLNEAVNILEGRPVYKGQENADGTINHRWLELTRVGKDPNATHELLSFSPSQTFDLKKTLLENAIQLDFYSIAREAVQRGLEAGNKVEFQINGNGRYIVAANPSAKTVDFFDANKKPISLVTLKKIIHPVKREIAKELTFIKQKDITQENQIQINR